MLQGTSVDVVKHIDALLVVVVSKGKNLKNIVSTIQQRSIINFIHSRKDFKRISTNKLMKTQNTPYS